MSTVLLPFTFTPGLKAVLQENSVKTYSKDDAGLQPGNLQEVLLYETPVSWIRRREARNRISKCDTLEECSEGDQRDLKC